MQTRTRCPQGVSELRMELIKQQASERVLSEMPEVHQFLDGFYLSRIGIRILIGECTDFLKALTCLSICILAIGHPPPGWPSQSLATHILKLRGQGTAPLACVPFAAH